MYNVNKNIHDEYFVFSFSSPAQFLFLDILAEMYLIIFESKDLSTHDLPFAKFGLSVWQPKCSNNRDDKGGLTQRTQDSARPSPKSEDNKNRHFGFSAYFLVSVLKVSGHPSGV